MKRIAIINVSLVVLFLAGLVGCITVNPPSNREAPVEPVPQLTPPVLLTPANGATGIDLTPVLLWQEMPDAGGYDLEVSRYYDFSDPLHSVSSQIAGYEVREPLEPSTTYYWVVISRRDPADPDSEIASSPVWKFTTKE